MRVTTAEIDARLDAARRAIADIDLFVAPSASIAAEFERLGAHRSRIRVSDYGFAPMARVARREPSRPLRIGFVGTLVWHKGVHVLIDAVRGLPDDAYELKIFGDPDVFADYSTGLRAQAAGLPVRFMGAFTRERAADVYAQIDVLAVPSLWLENSPLVIHEAFQSGVPVVASCAGGIPGLVDDGRNGVLCEPADAAALARALRPLVDDPSRVAALARAMPRVKPIDEDASAWDAIYADVARREAPAAQML